MEKLIQIKGKWEEIFAHQYNALDKCEGSLLVEESGWFEGIVKEPTSFFGGEKFVCGVFLDGIIYILKLPIKRANKAYSFIAPYNKEKNNYSGQYDLIDMKEEPQGNCEIKIEKEIIDELEINKFKLKLNEMKLKIPEISQKYYEKSICNKEETINFIKESNEHKKYEKENYKKKYSGSNKALEEILETLSKYNKPSIGKQGGILL